MSTALAAYSIWKTRPSGEKVVTARSYPVPMLLIFLSLSFDPSCSSSSSSVLYVCVFKNSAKSETPGRRGLFGFSLPIFLSSQEIWQMLFFFFFFQTFAIFGLHKLEGDGRWDSFFFFLGPIRKFHWYEPA